MTIKVVFFDFDGTIADTLNVVVSITNRLALEFGHKPIQPEELAKIKKFSSRQIIKYSGISILKVPFLLARVRAELRKEIETVETFPELKAVLIELRNQVDTLGILSSNSQDNIVAFLSANNLHNLFDFVYTEAPLFSKSRIINKILKQTNVKPEESIYVGDETRDIEAAKRSHIKAIAVSWGFNSKEILAQQSPDFLIHKPSELIDIILNLQNNYSEE